MLFADNIDRKLLPKNILILNSRIKWETLVEFCLKYDINFKMFELANNNHFNISQKLKPYTTYLPKEKLYDPQYYIKTLDFEPEYIMNCRDEEPITTVEYKLSLYYNTKTQFDKRALKFFTSKKEQDRVCKLMGIPTLDEGSIDDKIIVKLDSGKSGGGTGYKIINKKNYIPKKNDFIQRYINYDYCCNQHTLVDNNGDYHIYNHFLGKFGDGHIIGNNILYMYLYPFTNFPKEDIAIVEEFYKKLKENITVKNRILITEFCRERNGKLYFQEFNSRPSGEFENGTFDWNIGKFNTLVDYFTNNVQEEIEYYQQTIEIYLENINNNELFGWGGPDGMKGTSLPFSQKIKVFNTTTK